jgi:YNFM family putative membrane transporter
VTPGRPERPPAGAATAYGHDGAGHVRGTPDYRRLSAALWLAGVATFTMLYAVQALLPAFTQEYGAPPATASLALSATTGALAVALVPVTALAERSGRVRVMTLSLALAATLGLLAPLAPTFAALLAVRLVQGVAMAGIPALAMAHTADECTSPTSAEPWASTSPATPSAASRAGSWPAPWRTWRAGGGACGRRRTRRGVPVAFRLLLPPPRAEQPPAAPLALPARRSAQHLRDPGIRALCLTSFLLMSAFVTVYNYRGSASDRRD